MKLPSVLLFGQTNVGKSTLFNRLTHSKAAVVYDQPGVTRDFITAEVDQRFCLMDSGGLFSPTDAFSKSVEGRVWEAVRKANVIVWVLDGRKGLTPMDRQISQELRKLDTPKILAVNKLDKETDEENLAEFYRLGWDVLIPISAEHDVNIDLLQEAILQALPATTSEVLSEVELPLTAKFALVGRPNVGKSSLTNALLKEERVLVSDVAGTTRDAIDCPFTWTFKKTGKTERFILVDTAGIRKKTKDAVEFYASVRTDDALAKVDIAVILLDILAGPTAIDKALINDVCTLGKGCVLVVNKWDIAREKLAEEGENVEKFQQSFLDEIRKVCPFSDAPIVFISAKTGEGLELLLNQIKALQKRLQTKVSTGALNRFFQKMQLKTPPTSCHGKHFKIYYATQKEIRPFTLKVFCNRLVWMPQHYKRFLENNLREMFHLAGCPICWEWVEKPKRGETIAEF